MSAPVVTTARRDESGRILPREPPALPFHEYMDLVHCMHENAFEVLENHLDHQVSSPSTLAARRLRQMLAAFLHASTCSLLHAVHSMIGVS